MPTKNALTLLFVLVLLLAACRPGTVEEQPAAQEPAATDEPVPADAPEEPAATEAPPAIPPMAMEPQEVVFQASDGQELTGLYYPAAVNPAPLVVLMHWVGGDMSDWYEIAVWLQNRGQANPFQNPGSEDWWDPAWFPPIPADASYGVFIFSYRTCEPYKAGCPGWMPDVWLLDTQAAALKAAELEGVDPTRIVTIGSSIGADGAADGCLYLEEQVPGSCKGAASLTPGDYLTLTYSVVVERLGEMQPPVPAWCLTTTEEAAFCHQIVAPNLKVVVHQDAQHGNFIMVPEAEPLGLQTILDFLAETVGP
ncbi:MAG: hypothetical protein FJZ96_00465 [Chloroflexi bacterium]|nr:hypothetical protein [Chloroflexota bacterium]